MEKYNLLSREAFHRLSEQEKRKYLADVISRLDDAGLQALYRSMTLEKAKSMGFLRMPLLN